MSALEHPPYGAVIHPLRNPQISIDVREVLVAALERELADRCGGNAVLNRLEAEQRVDAMLAFSRGFDFNTPVDRRIP